MHTEVLEPFSGFPLDDSVQQHHFMAVDSSDVDSLDPFHYSDSDSLPVINLQTSSQSAGIDSLANFRQVREEQARAFQHTLHLDRERTRQRMIERQIAEDSAVESRIAAVEVVERERRTLEWHRRIRLDLAQSVPPEPPQGTQDVLHTRIRFPDGSKVSRAFKLCEPVDALNSFVGSLESINPRSFRILVHDGPVPTRMSSTPGTPLYVLGLSAFTVLIAENVTDDSNQPEVDTSEVERPTSPELIVPETTNSETQESAHDVIDLTSDTSQQQTYNSLPDIDKYRSSVRSGFMRNGLFFLTTDRLKVFETVIKTYTNNETLHNKEMTLIANSHGFLPTETSSFRNERGIDGGGLRRELCQAFWDELGQKMDGTVDKVPHVLPRSPNFFHIGRFLSHGYMLTGYFSIQLSIVCTKVILCGEEEVTDDELMESFSRVVDPFEAAAFQNPTEDALKNVVTPLLSRYSLFSIPTVDTVPSLLILAARHALITRPYYAQKELRWGMMDGHPGLWSKINTPALVNSLYDALKPTVPHVWAMISEPPTPDARRDTIFDFLRRFVHSLSPDMLGRF